MEKWKTGTREYHFNTTMGKAIQLCASRLFPALLPFRDMCKNVPLALCTNICSRNFLSPAKLGEIHHSRNLSRRAKTDVVRIVR